MIDYAGGGELLEAIADARTRFDGDAWVALFSDDVVYVTDPFEPPLVGHNALRAELLDAATFMEQVELTWERHWVVPPTILAPWRLSYVDRRSRARVALAGFATFEVAADGRIARAHQWSQRREAPTGG